MLEESSCLTVFNGPKTLCGVNLFGAGHLALLHYFSEDLNRSEVDVRISALMSGV